ncbi:uncharacterized protein N7506_010981 [Penicillium brevicompactum]|uniref:uncharacterized protein n=1 Tax=Penicillium brevicompactum TaxID=5074 RepID=UPI00254097AF|nr:uncharacterized protein N7506_010981 [Penicillium brevicompactum]KAJ5321851.1 hypothetical protein N7506_010981 [Penicillium brevicompactum]
MSASSAPTSMGEQNPSIARSRSRYRRNRPTTGNGPPPTPAISDHARTPPRQPARESPRTGCAARHTEEGINARDTHRQDAMDQLTGGDKSLQSRPPPSAIGKPPQKVDARQRLPRGEPAHPPRSAQSGEPGRKSFFQKVNLKVRDHVKKTDHAPKYIGVGGTGVVPGVDAPVSAVNAGERHALVTYGDAQANLAVTPSTQVKDLLHDAAENLSRDIDADKFILMESFSKLGLERPLRRYEHVRGVMNSWSHDSENRFIIIPPSSVEALAQLDAAHAPSEPPVPITVQIYHSQRPRKWDKRFVTLRADGQVTISKKEIAKEQTNICHLSDFDIYFPSARALNKDVKPPKKLCFAIKSQQKSSMFLSTENFLHFFSTSDRNVADKWYRAVQKWRSWYLVNKLGSCQKADVDTPLKRSGTRRSTRQRSIPHDVPLLDRESPAESPSRRSSDQPRPSSSKDIYARKKAQRGHVPPPSSYPNAPTIDTDVAGPFTDKEALISGVSPEEVETSTFSPSGLLGRTYTQRQGAMREREDREKRSKQEPFTGGLMAGTSYDSVPNSRSNTMTRAPDLSSFHKPLVDLTPVYAEPPQHSRVGKGHGVKVQPGMQLIDGATGPELTQGAIAIPPSTSWRRPAEVPQRRNTTRSVREREREPNPYTTPDVPVSKDFTPNSLLAHSASTATPRKQRTGHGVATGDRNATKPLLDMAPENPFSDGSLLRQL